MDFSVISFGLVGSYRGGSSQFTLTMPSSALPFPALAIWLPVVLVVFLQLSCGLWACQP